MDLNWLPDELLATNESARGEGNKMAAIKPAEGGGGGGGRADLQPMGASFGSPPRACRDAISGGRQLDWLAG